MQIPILLIATTQTRVTKPKKEGGGLIIGTLYHLRPVVNMRAIASID